MNSDTQSHARDRTRIGGEAFPASTMLISDDGAGGHFVLYGVNTDRPGAVIWSVWEGADTYIKSWKSFEDFLQECVADTVKLLDQERRD